MILLLFFYMPLKNKLSEVLSTKYRHIFEARWPNESPLQITAYKLAELTDLGDGTCLKLMNDESYLPTKKVRERLYDVFGLDSAEFLRSDPGSPE